MDRKFRKNKYLYHPLTTILLILVAPFIVILDIIGEIYHRIAFRLCKIPLVKRKEHIKIDRHKLKYLRWNEKLGCAYCGYANGFCSYITEIAGRTEKYWCGIQHQKSKGFKEQPHQKNFVKYGDEKAFKKKYG